jgi:DUF1680 family protein
MGKIMTRREFTRRASAAGAFAIGAPHVLAAATANSPLQALREFGYGQVAMTSAAHEVQRRETLEVLMNLSEDSLLKPFRQMAGLAAPGEDLGGWYSFVSDYDLSHDTGLAPGSTFGQWISALARNFAITGSTDIREKVLRLNRLYAATISEAYFEKNRFPAYCYDKLLVGLIDSHQYLADPDAFAILAKMTAAALPELPGRAIDREVPWRRTMDQSFRWDESYTIPENLFLASERGAGRLYAKLAIDYLDEASWFDALAEGKNVLHHKHAYSYVNSLSSAMQAYLALGSRKHLRAATNAFSMLQAQSFATGGWGPDEMLQGPDDDTLYASIEKNHNSFETPCGAYAHFKLTRYLLRATHDSRYGDSMERVMYNTVLGALPMHEDGRSFYYSDYHADGCKGYSDHRFPCCSGTLPQVAADYRINTYLHGYRAVYVNLYLPSTLFWQEDGAQLSLSQQGDYPFSDFVSFKLATTAPVRFALKLRIPAWADRARIEINGRAIAIAPVPGTFASIAREWHNGDRIDLELPRGLRLEAIAPRHPDTVALLSGPLVLFPLGRAGAPRSNITRRLLLSSRQVGATRWTAEDADQALTFAPFVGITDETYSTYLRLG